MPHADQGMSTLPQVSASGALCALREGVAPKSMQTMLPEQARSAGLLGLEKWSTCTCHLYSQNKEEG